VTTEGGAVRAAVVCESWFGNTRRLAEEIAAELGNVVNVRVLSVDEDTSDLRDLDLLVLGAPTHAHGLSRASTRRGAAQRLGGGTPGRGVRGWLHRLPPPAGTRAAVFDTRIEKPTFLVGSAARSIARRLERRGYELVAPPESFFVVDVEGPLKDGEIERARAWATSLSQR
jgi:hypothetical protein